VLLLGVCLADLPRRPLCGCPFFIQYTCGTDHVTYNNICNLRCERPLKPRLDVAHSGRCHDHNPNSGCLIPHIYFPVCGTDEKTYDYKQCHLRKILVYLRIPKAKWIRNWSCYKLNAKLAFK
ncbi:unnamed protein product, partial [Leptidea sinapis]